VERKGSMKTRIFVFSVFSILLLITTVSFEISQVHAQTSCNAYKGSSIPDNEIDGVIGPEWNDAWSSQTAINPTGTADTWIKQDGTNLYIALRFTADSANPWVAIQFGQSFCMSPSADGALFGDDNYAPNGYKDIYFLESGQIGADATQNGVGAINVNASNTVVVELMKPLNSGDADGKDINWSQACSYPMVISWQSNGGGASGGSVNHAVGTPTVNTVFVSSDVKPVPEFPSATIVLIIGAVTILVAVTMKRHSLKKQRD
jgi:hypothetical protein